MNTGSGLDDVIAADTVLSEVDGAAGRLVIRGYSLSQLVGRRRFEQVLELLLDGLLEPPQGPLERALGTARHVPKCLHSFRRGMRDCYS